MPACQNETGRLRKRSQMRSLYELGFCKVTALFNVTRFETLFPRSMCTLFTVFSFPLISVPFFHHLNNISFIFNLIREVLKKKAGKKRSGWPLGLTPSHKAVRKMWKILTLIFDFGLWLYMTYNEFYPTIFFWPQTPHLPPLPAGTCKKFRICQNFLTS